MNKKYILAAILTILAVVVGVYMHMKGLSEANPQDQISDVLGITDDLKISNSIASFVEEEGDFIKITYKYVISHAGNYTAKSITAHNWFTDTPENKFEVLSMTSDSHLVLNPAFNGTTNTDILSGENTMLPMSNAEVFVTVRLNYLERSLKFVSYVDVAGKSDEEGSSASSSSASTVSSSKTSTSTSPSTSKPSTSKAPSTSSKSSSTSAAPVVIDYNFTGLQATAGGSLTKSITIGHNHGVKLVWSNIPTDCVRVAVPPNTQWQGNNTGAQGYKDIMNLKVDTVFSLNCGGEIYGVNVKVNPPKPSSSSSLPPVTVTSSESSDPITIPISQTSSTGRVGGTDVMGLYDAAEVTFSLPRRPGSVAGAATAGFGGKGQ